MNKQVVQVLLGFLLLLLAVAAQIVPSGSVERNVDEPIFLDADGPKLVVPNIVHQTYDYKAPSFFMYLSLLCVQRFIKPEKHYLIVNDEGNERKQDWENWQQKAKEGSWEFNLTTLIKEKKLKIKFLSFPISPPGNESLFAKNKAHQSDFVRLLALQSIGGIYLDTDAFAINNFESLRIHNFSIPFDNSLSNNPHATKRCNNGVLLAAPQSKFLQLWTKEYAHFHPNEFHRESSDVPFHLATLYPDQVNLEMNRISPISFGFQTSRLANAITCGIYVPPHNSKHTTTSASGIKNMKSIGAGNHHSRGDGRGAIWYPDWDLDRKVCVYDNTTADQFMYAEVSKKLVLHMTLTGQR